MMSYRAILLLVMFMIAIGIPVSALAQSTVTLNVTVKIPSPTAPATDTRVVIEVYDSTGIQVRDPVSQFFGNTPPGAGYMMTVPISSANFTPGGSYKVVAYVGDRVNYEYKGEVSFSGNQRAITVQTQSAQGNMPYVGSGSLLLLIGLSMAACAGITMVWRRMRLHRLVRQPAL